MATGRFKILLRRNHVERRVVDRQVVETGRRNGAEKRRRRQKIGRHGVDLIKRFSFFAANQCDQIGRNFTSWATLGYFLT